MNGVGWLCDECGKTEVVSGDFFVMNGPGQPPAGWYLLFKAQPERAAANERWEFCSLGCIHAQTRPLDRCDCIHVSEFTAGETVRCVYGLGHGAIHEDPMGRRWEYDPPDTEVRTDWGTR